MILHITVEGVKRLLQYVCSHTFVIKFPEEDSVARRYKIPTVRHHSIWTVSYEINIVN